MLRNPVFSSHAINSKMIKFWPFYVTCKKRSPVLHLPATKNGKTVRWMLSISKGMIQPKFLPHTWIRQGQILTSYLSCKKKVNGLAFANSINVMNLGWKTCTLAAVCVGSTIVTCTIHYRLVTKNSTSRKHSGKL